MLEHAERPPLCGAECSPGAAAVWRQRQQPLPQAASLPGGTRRQAPQKIMLCCCRPCVGRSVRDPPTHTHKKNESFASPGQSYTTPPPPFGFAHPLTHTHHAHLITPTPFFVLLAWLFGAVGCVVCERASSVLAVFVCVCLQKGPSKRRQQRERERGRLPTLHTQRQSRRDAAPCGAHSPPRRTPTTSLAASFAPFCHFGPHTQKHQKRASRLRTHSNAAPTRG